MVATKASSTWQTSATASVRRGIEAFDCPATPLFIGLTIVLGWQLWFAIGNANFASLMQICNHDAGAALRTDEIIALGQRPGVDFFYYYGPLPILLGRAFFAIFGRSPTALFALIGVFGTAFAAGLASIVEFFKPTRLGVLLVALASVHTITIPVPTHGLEAAFLIWSVAMRVRGHRSSALALAVCGIFAKISMGSVLLVGMIALTIFDVIRTRSSRPLVSLLAVPCALVILFVGCSLALGSASVIACFDPRLGAGLYQSADFGFLREGRNFWHPAGHTLGWYLGGVPGPWIAASVVLLALAPSAAVRLVRGVSRGIPRDGKAVADEILVVACVANLAFVTVFFGPSSLVSYYTWLLLVGVTPLLAGARWGSSRGGRGSRYGWLALAGFLILSSKSRIAHCINTVREPRVWVGGTSLSTDQAEDLQKALALAHATGRGVVTVVARVANFGRVDPTLRQGRYWMMEVGMRTTPSVAELVSLARSSDALFGSQYDCRTLMKIPELQPILTASERIYEGKYFFVMRPSGAPLPSQ